MLTRLVRPSSSVYSNCASGSARVRRPGSEAPIPPPHPGGMSSPSSDTARWPTLCTAVPGQRNCGLAGSGSLALNSINSGAAQYPSYGGMEIAKVGKVLTGALLKYISSKVGLFLTVKRASQFDILVVDDLV